VSITGYTNQFESEQELKGLSSLPAIFLLPAAKSAITHWKQEKKQKVTKKQTIRHDFVVCKEM